MKLKRYLALNAVKQKDFAARIGEKPARICLYCLGQRIPRPDVMQKIFAATNGAVTPNDFFLSDEQIAAAGHDDPARDPKGGAAC
nr:MAG TPA: repressor protein [Caudoviricetes sp.]